MIGGTLQGHDHESGSEKLDEIPRRYLSGRSEFHAMGDG